MRIFSYLFLVYAVFLMAFPAMAASLPGGGGGLPWETPLTEIKDSLSGPVATAIGMMGFVIAGAVLVFGGDLSGFVRTIIMLVLAVSVLLGANSLLSRFSGSGALIDASRIPHAGTSVDPAGAAPWN